jgi:hypothetical protein
LERESECRIDAMAKTEKAATVFSTKNEAVLMVFENHGSSREMPSGVNTIARMRRE